MAGRKSTYTVVYKIDDAQALAAGKRGAAMYAGLDRAALKSIKTAESVLAAHARAASAGAGSAAARMTGATAAGAGARIKVEMDAAKTIGVGYYKLASDTIKAEDKKRAAAEKRAADVAGIESAYMARDYQRRVKAEARKEKLDDFARSRTAKAITDRETLESSYLVRDYQARVKAEERKEKAAGGPYARLAQIRRKDLNDEQVAAAAKVQYTDAMNRKRIESARKALGAEHSNFAAAIRDAVGLKRSVDGISMSYGKLGLVAGATMFGLTKALEMAQKVGAAVQAAGEKSVERTARFGEARDQMGELATLMGEKADNKFTLEQAKFNARVGFTPEEGKAFLTEQYNSGAHFIDKNISKPDFKQLSEHAGRIAVARQVDPKIVGDLTGNLLGFSDYKKMEAAGKIGKGKASEEAAGKISTGLAILARGKGSTSVLAQQASRLASAALNEDDVKGTFTNAEDVMTAISVAAEKSDTEAEVIVRATIRGMRDFEGKAGALLKRAGIKPQDKGLFAGLEKLGPVVEAEARARKVPVQDILRENFSDIREAEGIGVFVNRGIGPKGAIADRQKFAREQGGAAGAMKLIADSERDERTQRRLAMAGVELEQARRGAENSKLDIIRTRALQSLVRKREIDTNTTGIKDYLVGSTSFGLLGSGEQVRIDEEAQRLIQSVTPARAEKGKWSDYLNFSPLSREQDLNEQIERARKAGANPVMDIGAIQDRARERAERAARAIGPQAMTAPGGFGPMGLRSALAATAMGAIRDEAIAAPAEWDAMAGKRKSRFDQDIFKKSIGELDGWETKVANPKPGSRFFDPIFAGKPEMASMPGPAMGGGAPGAPAPPVDMTGVVAVLGKILAAIEKQGRGSVSRTTEALPVGPPASGPRR